MRRFSLTLCFAVVAFCVLIAISSTDAAPPPPPPPPAPSKVRQLAREEVTITGTGNKKHGLVAGNANVDLPIDIGSNLIKLLSQLLTGQ